MKSAQQTPRLSSLRIAYKTQETRARKKKANNKKERDIQPIKTAVPATPLPMFDDYKFKAKDHDPL